MRLQNCAHVMTALALMALPRVDAIAQSAESVVGDLMEAFNKHDVDAMMSLVTEDVNWYSVMADSVAVEASGRRELRNAMASYFEAVPSARSSIETIIDNGAFLAGKERAFWNVGSKLQSQASIAVYRVEDGAVARVWYFPAQE